MARILIVEDDSFFADVLACTLGLDGHEVAVADSASEGVRRGRANCYDLVVAAWRLKGDMHGGTVCRRIRAAWPSVKALVITGHHECALEAAQYGKCVAAVLIKPFHRNEILEAVRQALVAELVLASPHLPVSCSLDEAVPFIY
jgi:two-component system, cell cycle response regulator CpdR